MTTILRPVGLVASGVFAIGMFYASVLAHAAPVNNEVMLVNAKTGKCATIAGGVSPAPHGESVPFACDCAPIRRWPQPETRSGC